MSFKENCGNCASRDGCVPLLTMTPFGQSLVKSGTFPPPCGGQLYVKQEFRPTHMRSFEQYKKTKPAEQKPEKKEIKGLDDLEW